MQDLKNVISLCFSTLRAQLIQSFNLSVESIQLLMQQVKIELRVRIVARAEDEKCNFQFFHYYPLVTAFVQLNYLTTTGVCLGISKYPFPLTSFKSLDCEL